jgi:hypothetical protein
MLELREKRQHLQSFLLRHGRIYAGRRPWTKVLARWLSNLTFSHPAQSLVLREYRQSIEDTEARLERLTDQVTEVVSSWSMAPVVDAYHRRLPNPQSVGSNSGEATTNDQGTYLARQCALSS